MLTAILYADVTARRLAVDWCDDAYSDDGTNTFPAYFDCPWIGGIDELPAGASIEPPLWDGRLGVSVDDLRRQAGLPKREFNRSSRIDVGRVDYQDQIAVFWSPKDKVRRLHRILPPELSGVPTDELLGSTLRERLPLQPALGARVERFRSEHLPDRTVGVHVRYSDKRSDVDGLFEELGRARQADSGLGVFLATDNVEVKERFEREHPDLVSAPHWYPSVGERSHGNPAAPSLLEHGAEALVDLYLLAGCEHLLFDTGPTFARVAALLRDQNRGVQPSQSLNANVEVTPR